MASPITTHVLDTHLGSPAEGMAVTLFKQDGKQWLNIAHGITNHDGRISDWLDGQAREVGIYKITFETDPYFERLGQVCFYPSVSFEFRITDATQHYHVPLLVSAHAISSYRGS
jgi:5-hydroxyisourate hydrolase